MAAIFLILLYLPSHPPYYQAAVSTVAKTYSNSILAVLNSRVKVVANFTTSGSSLWNEVGDPAGSIHLARRSQGLMFHREGETGSNFTSDTWM